MSVEPQHSHVFFTFQCPRSRPSRAKGFPISDFTVAVLQASFRCRLALLYEQDYRLFGKFPLRCCSGSGKLLSFASASGSLTSDSIISYYQVAPGEGPERS